MRLTSPLDTDAWWTMAYDDDATQTRPNQIVLNAPHQREAKNKHRKLEAERLTKAYETAVLHWFRHRALGI